MLVIEYSESIVSLMKPENSHRYLACRRGWTEEELTMNIDGGPEGDKFHEKNLARFERHHGGDGRGARGRQQLVGRGDDGGLHWFWRVGE